MLKPVRQIPAITPILARKGHLVLRVDVSSHRNVQPGKVMEAGEGWFGMEGRDEESEFRGGVAGWVGQGKGVARDL